MTHSTINGRLVAIDARTDARVWETLDWPVQALVARIEAERQALAMMDHPSIAKVHDAGATETGRRSS